MLTRSVLLGNNAEYSASGLRDESHTADHENAAYRAPDIKPVLLYPHEAVVIHQHGRYDRGRHDNRVQRKSAHKSIALTSMHLPCRSEHPCVCLTNQSFFSRTGTAVIRNIPGLRTKRTNFVGKPDGFSRQVSSSSLLLCRRATPGEL